MWSELKMTYKARNTSLSRSIRERREIWNSNCQKIYSILEIFVLRMGSKVNSLTTPTPSLELELAV